MSLYHEKYTNGHLEPLNFLQLMTISNALKVNSKSY